MKNCIIIMLTLIMALMLIGYFYLEEEPVREDFLARARYGGIIKKGKVEDYVVTYWFNKKKHHFLMKQLPPSEQMKVLENSRPTEKEHAYMKTLMGQDH